MYDFDDLDLEATVNEATNENNLKFLHFFGEKIYSGEHPDFAYRPIYLNWKQKYLPKFIPLEIQNALRRWKHTISPWIEEALPTILNDTFAALLEAYEYEGVTAEELVEDIKNNHADKLAYIKRKLAEKIEREDFKVEDFAHLTEISDFITEYLSLCYIDNSGDETKICSTDSIPISEDDQEPVKITTNDLQPINNELSVVLKRELIYCLDNEPPQAILNQNNTLTKRLPDEPTAELINQLNIGPFANSKKTLMTQFCKKKGQGVLGVLPKTAWDNVSSRQLKQIKEQINSTALKHFNEGEEIQFTKAFIKKIIRTTGIPVTNLILEEMDYQTISRTIKHIFYFAFNQTDGSKSGFLYVYLNLEQDGEKKLQECLANTGNLLRDALIAKRDAQFTKTTYTLPYDPIDESWAGPEGWYVTKFPHNYSLPPITSQAELFAALKLSQRSLIRYYKSLNTSFFKPTLKVRTINKHPTSVSYEPQTALEGDEHCYHFPLHRIGRTTIVFKISKYGIIDPYVQAFGTYAEARERLIKFKKNFQAKVPALNDVIIANWISQIAFLHADAVRAAGIPVSDINSVLQFLCDFTMCLLYVEFLRNKACFVSHALVLQKIADPDDELTFADALPREFPAGPKESSGPGRLAHAQITQADNTLLGPDAKQQQRDKITKNNIVALQDRELSAINRYGESSHQSLVTLMRKFSGIIQKPLLAQAAAAPVPAAPKQQGVGKAPALRRR